jgi:hypothetical protein
VYFIFYAPELISFMKYYSPYSVERGMSNMILDALMGCDYSALMENWEFGDDSVLLRVGTEMAMLVKTRFPEVPKEIYNHWDSQEAIDLWGDDGGTVYVLDDCSIMIAYNPDLKGSQLKDINLPHEIHPLGQ